MKKALLLLFIFILFSCDKDSTGPKEDVCSFLTISRNMYRADSPSISVPCEGGGNSTMSNIRYDQYSRIISYDFTITCSNSSKSYSGNVSNVVYNSLGEVLSYDAVINGKSCHYTKE